MGLGDRLITRATGVGLSADQNRVGAKGFLSVLTKLQRGPTFPRRVTASTKLAFFGLSQNCLLSRYNQRPYRRCTAKRPGKTPSTHDIVYRRSSVRVAQEPSGSTELYRRSQEWGVSGRAASCDAWRLGPSVFSYLSGSGPTIPWANHSMFGADYSTSILP